MTYPSLSLTEDQIMTGLRAFILNVLPADVECIQGQGNAVTYPAGANFVVMTPAQRTQLSQTVTSYAPDTGDGNGTKQVDRSTSLAFQLDTYGPSASDNVQIITTLFRDEYGVVFFAPYGLAPLFCDDGQQMPLVTGEATYMQRWTMRGTLQTNLAVTVAAQFADNLITTLSEIV